MGGLLACTIAGLSLMATNPAKANVTVTETCNVDVDPDTQLTLFVGETLTINMDGTCDRITIGAPFKGKATVTVGGVTTEYEVDDRTALINVAVPTLIVYTATQVGEARLQVFRAFPSYAGQIWRITVVAAPDPDPTLNAGPSVTAQGLAPLIQQFGKSDVGSCDDAASDELNWAGVASGGWSESWAQWMNDGRGGAVCTRTLIYQQDHSRWAVN
jgi:hypothetical protein